MYPRALRAFMQRPVANLAIALSLALGISGTSAVLQLADSLFERGAPGVNGARSLAKLYFHDPERGSYSTLSYANFRDYAAATSVFESLTAAVTLPFTVSLNGTASRLSVGLVSPNFLSALRVELWRGRTFESRSEAEDAGSAVISYDLWRRAGAPDLANLRIEVNGSRFGVIGVASPGFHGASRKDGADVWVPAAAGPKIATGFMPANLLQDRDLQWFDVVGRLRPGISFQEAQAEVKGRTAWLERLDPKVNNGKDLALGDWHDVAIGTDRVQMVRRTAVLGIAAVLVLMIACANVANLLIGRNLARRPEIALRFALGASRMQVGRMILGESLVFALVAGVLGSALEAASGSLWASLGLPVAAFDFRLDARSALLTLVVSVTAGLLVGAIPAALASRRELLHRTAAGTGSARGLAWGGWLVVGEVALALVSLAVSALIVQSLHNELTSGFGYNPEKLAVAQVDLESRRYSVDGTNGFYRDFLSRIRSDRRISAASMVRFLPFDDTSISWQVFLPDRPEDKSLANVSINLVELDFFRTMQLPMVEGRDLRGDAANTGAVVSESFAHRVWPNRSAVGQRISLMAASGPFLEILGVAKDAKWSGLQEPPRPCVYLSSATAASLNPFSNFATGMQFVVRTHGDPRQVLSELRQAAAAMDPSLPMTRLTTLSNYISKAAEGERNRALLLATLAAICMVLCAIGVYAVLAEMLAARAQEMAVRLALGASPPDLWRRVVLRGGGQILIGAILGLALTWVLGRLVESQLYDVGARDILTLGLATFAVLGMGLSICLIQGGKVVQVASKALMAEIRRQ